MKREIIIRIFNYWKITKYKKSIIPDNSAFY